MYMNSLLRLYNCRVAECFREELSLLMNEHVSVEPIKRRGDKAPRFKKKQHLSQFILYTY